MPCVRAWLSLGARLAEGWPEMLVMVMFMLLVVVAVARPKPGGANALGAILGASGRDKPACGTTTRAPAAAASASVFSGS